MANVALYAGVALILFGVVAFTGALPLSVFASSVSVDCSNWPTGCTVNAPVTNTGTSGFAAPFTAYFVYKDTTGATDLIDQVAWTASQSSVSDSGFTPQKVPGAGGNLLGFTANVFFWDANGYPMGSATSQTFSIPIKWTIFYATVGSITVSPPGGSPTSCTSSSCTSSLAYYQAYWPAGTSLTVTTSGGTPPVTWSYGGTQAQACPASGSGFACTFSVSSTVTAGYVMGGSSVSQNLIVVNAISGTAASINPPSACLSATAYQTSSYGNCGPTASFTLTPTSGLSWSGSLWTLSGAQFNPPIKGNSTTVSLSYSQLAPSVTFSAGVAFLALQVASGTTPVTLSMLQAPLGNGQFAATTPAAGTYTCSSTSSVCKPGGTVSVSVTIPSGYQFNGWIVNGQNVGMANPYTVSIPTTGAVAVSPVVTICPSTGCTAPPPPPPFKGFGTSQVVGIMSMAGGFGLALLGLKRKR